MAKRRAGPVVALRGNKNAAGPHKMTVAKAISMVKE